MYYGKTSIGTPSQTFGAFWVGRWSWIRLTGSFVPHRLDLRHGQCSASPPFSSLTRNNGATCAGSVGAGTQQQDEARQVQHGGFDFRLDLSNRVGHHLRCVRLSKLTHKQRIKAALPRQDPERAWDTLRRTR
mgnify:CR=1 FL=1